MSAGSILLLATPQSYRLAAFQRAASSIDATVFLGIDTPPGYEHQDARIIPLTFADPVTSLESIQTRPELAHLSAVIAVDDSAADLAAFLAGKLGLRRNLPGSEIAGRDKAIMRDRFEAADLLTPRRYVLKVTDDPSTVLQVNDFPVVIKPTSLNGSRGVIRANTIDEATAAFSRTAALVRSLHSDTSTQYILIEQFIPGFEVAVEGVMTSGSLTTLALFDKPDPLDGPYFEETIYVTPSRLPQPVQAEIHQTTERMALAIGVIHGPVHAELRINDRGVWPIEVAARSIGGMCSTVLQFGSGMSLEELILRHAIGETINPASSGSSAVGVMMIPIPHSGILKSVGGISEALATPGITGVEITAPLNAPITGLPEGDAYLGFIFAKGESPAEVETALRESHDRLVIEIGPMVRLTTTS